MPGHGTASPPGSVRYEQLLDRVLAEQVATWKAAATELVLGDVAREFDEALAVLREPLLALDPVPDGADERHGRAWPMPDAGARLVATVCPALGETARATGLGRRT